MEAEYNRKHGARKRSFEKGDLIYTMAYTKNKKFWVPAVILNTCGSVMYFVRTNDNDVWKRHVNQIKERSTKVSSKRIIPINILLDEFDIDPETLSSSKASTPSASDKITTSTIPVQENLSIVLPPPLRRSTRTRTAPIRY